MGRIAEDPPPKKLPFRQVLGYGLGHVFNDICASLWFTYLLIFLQKVNNSFFCSPNFFYKYHIRDPFKKININLNKSQVLKFSSADAGTSRYTFKSFQKHKHLPENQVAQFILASGLVMLTGQLADGVSTTFVSYHVVKMSILILIFMSMITCNCIHNISTSYIRLVL